MRADPRCRCSDGCAQAVPFVARALDQGSRGSCMNRRRLGLGDAGGPRFRCGNGSRIGLRVQERPRSGLLERMRPSGTATGLIAARSDQTMVDVVPLTGETDSGLRSRSGRRLPTNDPSVGRGAALRSRRTAACAISYLIGKNVSASALGNGPMVDRPLRVENHCASAVSSSPKAAPPAAKPNDGRLRCPLGDGSAFAPCGWVAVKLGCGRAFGYPMALPARHVMGTPALTVGVGRALRHRRPRNGAFVPSNGGRVSALA